MNSIRGRSSATSGEKAEESQFFVLAVFEEAEGQALSLKFWGPFAEVIGMTARDFVELEEDKQKAAIVSIDSGARYGIVVKLTKDGFELTNLEPSGGR